MQQGKLENNFPHLSDSQIWDKLKNGSTSALGYFYDKYIDCLFAYGIKFSKDRDTVKDCIHDLFVDLYKYRSNLASTDNVRAYLISSLRRKILSGKSQKVAPVQSQTSEIEDLQKDTTISREEEVILSEIKAEKGLKLTIALDSLTKKQRKGLLLRFDQDKSYEDISEIMNTSVATARTTIYRALKQLRKQALFFFFSIHIYFFC